jgi:phosphate transport system substrate-binding protein
VKALHFILSLLLCALPCAAQTLVIKGSDTLGAKLVPQLKEEFRALHPETTFEIAAEGSSTGVAAIISSTADIGMSSRPVTQEEVSKARLNGVDMQMITVAFDGMALIVNEHNPVQSLTRPQVLGISRALRLGGLRRQAGRISVYPLTRLAPTALPVLAMRKATTARVRRTVGQ